MATYTFYRTPATALWLTLLMLIAAPGFAQQNGVATIVWEKVQGYESDGSTSINKIKPIKGGYIAIGSWEGIFTAGSGAWVIRLDTKGNEIWHSFLHVPGGDASPIDVCQTSDSGFVILTGGGTIYFVKIDSQGRQQWATPFSSGSAFHIEKMIASRDGGFIAVGSVYIGYNNVDGYIGRFDKDGVNTANKNWGGSWDEVFTDVKPTADGGYILCGVIGSTDGEGVGNHGRNATDCWVFKLDADLNKMWGGLYGGSRTDQAYSIDTTADGGYIVGGQTESGDGDVTEPATGVTLFWLFKLNGAGQLLWDKGYNNFSHATQMIQTANKGFVLAGFTSSAIAHGSGAGNKADIYLVKTDSTGNMQWDKVIGGTGHDYIYYISEASPLHYIIGGVTQSNDGDVHSNPYTYLVNPHAWALLVKETVPLKAYLKANTLVCTGKKTTISVGTTGGLKPYRYSLNGGPFQASNNFSTGAGTYTITVMDANNSAYTTAAITIAQPLTALNLSGSRLLPPCNAAAGTITAIAAGGYGKYLFSFGSAAFAPGNTFTGLGAGSYQVKVKDSMGCVAGATVKLTMLQAAIRAANQTICYGAATTVTVTAAGGVQPYTYLLNDSALQATGSFSVKAGSYVATVTDAAGCAFKTGSVTISQPENKLTINAINTNTSCISAADATTTASATGGYSNYVYSINSGPFTAAGTFSNLAAGLYKVQAKDGKGCGAGKNITIAAGKAPCATLVNAVQPGKGSAAAKNTLLIASVSPNPGAAYFTLTLQGGNINAPVAVQVYNVLGQPVFTAKGQVTTRFTFGQNFIPGNYLVQVVNGENNSTLHIVKIK